MLRFFCVFSIFFGLVHNQSSIEYKPARPFYHPNPGNVLGQIIPTGAPWPANAEGYANFTSKPSTQTNKPEDFLENRFKETTPTSTITHDLNKTSVSSSLGTKLPEKLSTSTVASTQINLGYKPTRPFYHPNSGNQLGQIVPSGPSWPANVAGYANFSQTTKTPSKVMKKRSIDNKVRINLVKVDPGLSSDDQMISQSQISSVEIDDFGRMKRKGRRTRRRRYRNRQAKPGHPHPVRGNPRRKLYLKRNSNSTRRGIKAKPRILDPGFESVYYVDGKLTWPLARALADDESFRNKNSTSRPKTPLINRPPLSRHEHDHMGTSNEESFPRYVGTQSSDETSLRVPNLMKILYGNNGSIRGEKRSMFSPEDLSVARGMKGDGPGGSFSYQQVLGPNINSHPHSKTFKMVLDPHHDYHHPLYPISHYPYL